MLRIPCARSYPIKLAKALGPSGDNKNEGKKSGGVRITASWMMSESHLITIEFEFSSNRWRRLLIFFSCSVFSSLLATNVIDSKGEPFFVRAKVTYDRYYHPKIAVRIRFVGG